MQAADKSDAITIAVTRDGKVYLNTTQMPPADLPLKVKDMVANRLDKTVFVRADQRARYEKVVDVVNNLRASGVDQIGLLTEQAQVKPKPAAGAPAGQ
jgi:biopolymer transport protein ExbD/biopolymer transport protein TolR